MVLDTNVVSELMRRAPDEAVLAWIDQQPPAAVCTTAITVAEVRYGIARLPSYMLQDELADGRLRWLLRDYQTRSTPVFLVHPYQGGLPRRTQLLVDYLLAWFERARQRLLQLQG